MDLLSQHIKDILAERSQKSAGSSVEELSTGGVPISRSSSSTSSVGGAGTSGGGNVSITAGSTPKRDGATQRRMTDTKSPSMIGSDDHHLKMIRNIAK